MQQPELREDQRDWPVYEHRVGTKQFQHSSYMTFQIETTSYTRFELQNGAEATWNSSGFLISAVFLQNATDGVRYALQYRQDPPPCRAAAKPCDAPFVHRGESGAFVSALDKGTYWALAASFGASNSSLRYEGSFEKAVTIANFTTGRAPYYAWDCTDGTGLARAQFHSADPFFAILRTTGDHPVVMELQGEVDGIPAFAFHRTNAEGPLHDTQGVPLTVAGFSGRAGSWNISASFEEPEACTGVLASGIGVIEDAPFVNAHGTVAKLGKESAADAGASDRMP